MKSCQKCCLYIFSFLPLNNKITSSLPDVKINMYNSDSDDDSDINNFECQQLLTRSSASSALEDIESEFLTEEIDEAALKMFCLDRINLIQEDLKDPTLTHAERIIDETNLKALKNILINVRLSEKIKLGSLENSQYTDAVILQKQVVCNLAGQKEYSDVIKPVVINQQPQSMALYALSDRESCQTEDPKPIIKVSKTPKNNILTEPALAV